MLVHVAETSDPVVEQLVGGMVKDNSLLWTKATPGQLAGWMEWQARVHAGGLVESKTLGAHPLSEVTRISLDDFHPVAQSGGEWSYVFAGKAWSENYLIPWRRRWTEAQGTLGITFDQFGRVTVARGIVQ